MKWFIKNNELASRLSLLLLTFCFGLFLFTLRRLPPQVPLFYSLPWGEQQLSPTIGLLFLPLGLFLIAILNFFLSMANFRAYPLAAKILIWLTVGLIFLVSFDLLKIIFIIL